MKKFVLAGVLAGALAMTGTALGAVTVDVDPGNMSGWVPAASGTATIGMADGPAGQPLGPGSARFEVGADGSSAAQLRFPALNGMPLQDIEALTYNTYVDEDGSGGQAPYLILNVDHDGNGTIDDQLFFEPVYQSGTYSGDPVPDQGALLIDSWQDWDAVAGGWWSLNAATFGPPLVTLASYLASHPGARLAAPPSGAGSIRIVTGFGAGAWDGFEGNVDAFTVNGTTYNFEANPTSMNSCKNNGFAAFTSPRTFKNQGDCVKFTTTGK